MSINPCRCLSIRVFLIHLQKMDFSNDSFLQCFDIGPNEFLKGALSLRSVIVEGLCICLSGECDIVIDQRSYTLHRGDLFVVLPDSILHAVRKSHDFRARGIVADINCLENLSTRISLPVSMFLLMKDNPCVSMTEEELQFLLALSDVILLSMEKKDHPYHKDLSTTLLQAISFEVAAIYQRCKPVASRKRTRQDEIFYKFLSMVSRQSIRQREVDYYANMLCITPRYLSVTVKQVSGESASFWIARSVILKAKELIGSTSLTIKQVSDKLNFPNPSFFGQFFKRKTGLTPRQNKNSL